MVSNNGLFLRITFSACLFLGLLFPIAGHTKTQDADFNNIAPPDEKGPYDVGIRTFENVPVSGVPLTRIQVYYPIEPTDPNLDPTDCPNTYTISVFSGVAFVGTYQKSSPLCAVQDATVAPGPFPLIVHDHGGGTAGPDNVRVQQLPVHETLASHGFVVVAIRHAANQVARVRDIPLVIDYMLGRNTTPGDPLFGRIAPDRIGISGHSEGGRIARRVAGGWADQGLVADPRVKAMVLYEPGADLLGDASTISIPYLVMGGNRYGPGGVPIPDLFDATVLATPRIYVLNPEALHSSYTAGLCSTIEETREAALLADPTLVEPLTNLNTNSITGLRTCNPNPNIDPTITDPIIRANIKAAAVQACMAWNLGETQFNLVGNIAFGGGRNLCTRVGVNSSRSLDINPPDGFTDLFVPGTDTKLFEANDKFNYIGENPEQDPAPPPAEIMVPMIKLYTVAFWKKFLEGDDRYMRYLTPGYANTQNLQAVVTIVDEEE